MGTEFRFPTPDCPGKVCGFFEMRTEVRTTNLVCSEDFSPFKRRTEVRTTNRRAVNRSHRILNLKLAGKAGV